MRGPDDGPEGGFAAMMEAVAGPDRPERLARHDGAGADNPAGGLAGSPALPLAIPTPPDHAPPDHAPPDHAQPDDALLDDAPPDNSPPDNPPLDHTAIDHAAPQQPATSPLTLATPTQIGVSDAAGAQIGAQGAVPAPAVAGALPPAPGDAPALTPVPLPVAPPLRASVAAHGVAEVAAEVPPQAALVLSRAASQPPGLAQPSAAERRFLAIGAAQIGLADPGEGWADVSAPAPDRVAASGAAAPFATPSPVRLTVTPPAIGLPGSGPAVPDAPPASDSTDPAAPDGAATAARSAVGVPVGSAQSALLLRVNDPVPPATTPATTPAPLVAPALTGRNPPLVRLSDDAAPSSGGPTSGPPTSGVRSRTGTPQAGTPQAGTLRPEAALLSLSMPDTPRVAQPAPPSAPPLTPATLPALVRSVAQADGTTVELVLTPEDLGKLRFEVSRAGDQIRLHLMVERPETLDLLRRHADQVLTEFRAAGYSGATLSFGQWGQGGQQSAPPDPPAPAPPPPPLAPAATPAATPTTTLAAPGAGLDLRL